MAVVIGFIDAINRGDIRRLGSLTALHHTLQVLAGPPLTDWEEIWDAWTSHTSTCPDYVIYPARIIDDGDTVVVIGSTTGSKFGLSDEEERRRTVIWKAQVHDGLLTLWQVIDDTPDQRKRLGLADQ